MCNNRNGDLCMGGAMSTSRLSEVICLLLFLAAKIAFACAAAHKYTFIFSFLIFVFRVISMNEETKKKNADVFSVVYVLYPLSMPLVVGCQLNFVSRATIECFFFMCFASTHQIAYRSFRLSSVLCQNIQFHFYLFIYCIFFIFRHKSN